MADTSTADTSTTNLPGNIPSDMPGDIPRDTPDEGNNTGHLQSLLHRLAVRPGVIQTDWPGLVVARLEQPVKRTPVVYAPSLCVVAEGQKLAYLGDRVFEYNPHNYLLCSLPLPIESEIPAATPERPVLATVLRFNLALLGRLLVEMEEFEEFIDWPVDTTVPAVAPCEMTPRVRAALIRLLQVVQHPMERRVLGPGTERELLFEVLRGPNGNLLRNFVLRDGSAHRVSRVVSFLEKHFREPLDIKSIAEQAGMSSSSLHQHFKRATSLSPIQFIKRMRLHEARAMLLRGCGASEVAFDVGYTSPSQFSREFRRMFGQSPTQVRA